MAGLTQDQQDQFDQQALAAGVPQSYIDSFTAANNGDQNRLISSYNSGQQGSGEDSSVTGGAWVPSGSSGSTGPSSAWNVSAGSSQRNAFYNQLMARASQSENVDPNDPIIKNQVDAYSAAQTRGGRDTLTQAAEAGGPYANMAGQQRMVAEQEGQNTAAFQANLVGQRQQQVSGEIENALGLGAGQLNADQSAALQQQQINNQYALGQTSNANQYDEYLRQLALNQWQAQDNSNLSWANL